MQFILGSQSPRRKEILEFFSLSFIQAVPPFNESAVPFCGNPEKYVCSLSRGKAGSLRAEFPEALILTADTIVFHDGKVYGKPKDREEGVQMLSLLSGKWHSVYTGVTVEDEETSFSRAEVTQVLFQPLTPEQIGQYLSSTDWKDKAGGYAIQGKGGIIVRKINGCYYNVMGLPIQTVESLLRHFDVELWNNL